ncbi:MAG: AAA family ATPase [Oscillospiraceae bacterium]|nr:AAA family ATPase [Oscillospiraceae bacterium]
MIEERQNQLNRIVIKGFKSIKECDLELRNINVLIGANGAGKSNFISLFEMLHNIFIRELSVYVAKKGVTSLLYNGKKTTESITAEFSFGTGLYSFKLECSENDSFIFQNETLIFEGKEFWNDGGHKESNALNSLRANDKFLEGASVFMNLGWRVYQFNDTSSTSPIKSDHNVSNGAFLLNDARNLAAYLYRLRELYPVEYGKILKAVQLIAPFFKDFVLEPMELNRELITLRWQQKGCEDIFNVSQLSDGTLRFICLATLLLQPTKFQPSTIIIDEPELGLHPYAITIFTELVKKAAINRQVILATQSVELLDHFEPEDVIVVDKDENGSKFSKFTYNELAEWLEDDYTLGDLWNKNIIGGRFAR